MGQEKTFQDISLPEITQEDLSLLPLSEVQAALEFHAAWGVSEIFADFPGFSTEFTEQPSQHTDSQASQRKSQGQALTAPVLPQDIQRHKKPFVEKAMPPASPVSLQLSVEAFSKALEKTSDMESALSCARSFGGAGLAQTALQEITGVQGVAGGGFIVGAEPSQDAERAGKIFEGAEAVLIKRLFSSVGIPFETLGSAPALPWRPPGGRTPLPEEIEICIPLLRKIIALNAPKWIVTFGTLPAKMLLEGTLKTVETPTLKEKMLRPAFRLSQVRGRWHQISLPEMKNSVHVFPLLAPERLKNAVKMRQTMWQELQSFKRSLTDILA